MAVARSGPSSLYSVPKVTAHPSTASVPITVLLYNGPVVCGYNVPVEGLTLITLLRRHEIGPAVQHLRQ